MNNINQNPDREVVKQVYRTTTRLKRSKRTITRSVPTGWVDMAPNEKVGDVRFLNESQMESINPALRLDRSRGSVRSEG